MKLKNKKTGEIKPAEAREDGIYLYDATTEQWYKYELDLLAKWWEYYEEPKEFYFIDQFMSVSKGVVDDVEYAGRHKAVNYAKKTSNNLKTAGNYFETREEAELAVRKLKAWKRLKEKGFRFKGWRTADLGADKYYFVITAEADDACKDDLDICFGGEE